MPGNAFDCQDWEPAPCKWLESTGKLLCNSPSFEGAPGNKAPSGPRYQQCQGQEALLGQQCVCMLSHFSRVRLFVTLWAVALQAPLSMGFSRQEY